MDVVQPPLWSQVDALLRGGRAPAVLVDGRPLALPRVARGRPRGEGFGGYRTRTAARRPRCGAPGCRRYLRKHDLLACSPGCAAVLRGWAAETLRILDEAPARADVRHLPRSR